MQLSTVLDKRPTVAEGSNAALHLSWMAEVV